MRLRRKSPPLGRQRQLPTVEKAPVNKTFSYRQRRSDAGDNTGRQLDRPEVKPAVSPLQFWLQRFGLIVLLIAALASAVNILTLSNHAKIQPLTAKDQPQLLRDTAVYETAASRLLAESVWNRNKITVDTAYVRRQLLTQFPELASVSVTIPLLAHRPVIYVQPGQPALLLEAANGTYIIDTSGKALLRGASAQALNQPKLPVVNDQSGLELRINHQALPTTTVSFIQTVMIQLAAKQFTVASMTLPAAASQLDVQIAGQPYAVKFNLQSNTPREQAGTFLATIAQLQKQNITPAKYVDVRVEGRAYYQ